MRPRTAATRLLPPCETERMLARNSSELIPASGAAGQSTARQNGPPRSTARGGFLLDKGKLQPSRGRQAAAYRASIWRWWYAQVGSRGCTDTYRLGGCSAGTSARDCTAPCAAAVLWLCYSTYALRSVRTAATTVRTVRTAA